MLGDINVLMSWLAPGAWRQRIRAIHDAACRMDGRVKPGHDMTVVLA